MNLRLRERREALGLNQKELAQKVGKSFRTIQSWEREESRQSTEKRRSKILETARDQAELSQNQAAAPEGERLEADQVRSA